MTLAARLVPLQLLLFCLIPVAALAHSAIPAPLNATYFLHDKSTPLPPDDD